MKIAIVENPRPLTIEHYNDVANAPLSASLNSGYALAVSREAGWETAYFDFTACLDDSARMAELILAENADLILFHWVYSWGNEAAVVALLDRLKGEDAGPTGAFGLFPTLACRKLSAYAPQLDFIIVGEFEKTLEELLRGYGKSRRVISLPGLFLKNETFGGREVVADPSSLPVPDDVGANRDHAVMNIAASRGCFGDCGFCFINSFYGCNKRRVRSIASFADELETRLERREIGQLYFIDPTFMGYGTREKERVMGISEVVKSFGIPFGFETRVDTVDERVMAVLAGNGAASVFLGIESGSDTVLQRINKRITKKEIQRAVRCVRDNGIRLNVGFIMFEPDSTIDELVENFVFLEETGLLSDHELTINMLYHSQIVLSGSKGWDRFEKEGRLIMDERLPFEANYIFRHDKVARVCSAMKRLATEYFLLIDRLSGRSPAASGVGGSELNLLLKEAFRSFLNCADTCTRQEYAAVEERYVADLRGYLLKLS